MERVRLPTITLRNHIAFIPTVSLSFPPYSISCVSVPVPVSFHCRSFEETLLNSLPAGVAAPLPFLTRLMIITTVPRTICINQILLDHSICDLTSASTAISARLPPLNSGLPIIDTSVISCTSPNRHDLLPIFPTHADVSLGQPPW